MKRKTLLFQAFPNNENTITKSYLLEKMKETNISEMIVSKAKAVFNIDYFFCEKDQELGEKGNCGKDWCNNYIPRNGKNGICKHWGYLFEESIEKYILTIDGRLKRVKIVEFVLDQENEHLSKQLEVKEETK